MSSIYYSIVRDAPLSTNEEAVIKAVENKYNNFDEIKELVLSSGGELLEFQASDQPGTLLVGEVQLPDDLFPDDIDDFIYVAETWFGAFSELRKSLPDASWKLTLDDAPLIWNEHAKKYEHPRR